MKSIANELGPQGTNPKTRARKSAHIAHPPGPVRRRTLPQDSQRSIRHPGGYESTETQTHSLQWIPASVTASDGRNDKIHIVCDIATVICDDMEDASSFVRYCGAAPKDQKNEHGLYSKLFNTASKNGDGKTLKIRSLPRPFGKEVFQAPSFTGKLCFHRENGSDGNGGMIVKADLCLNVNRALNHQRAALAKGRKDVVFKSPASVAKGLCGNDNLAPFQLAKGEHDHARNVYFERAISVIHADVKRAAKSVGAAWDGSLEVNGKPGNFSLRSVETCWDIGGAGFDAVKALADFTPALLEFGGKRGSQGNAGTVTIEFSSWESLVVYAKAPDRLRFEIRHCPKQRKRPYCSNTLTETHDKLDGFRDLATERVNAALSFLRSHQAASRTGSEWEAYAMAWGDSCGKSEASKAIYQILRQHGRILGGKCVECIAGGHNVLRNALKHGLIHHSHGAFRPVFSNDPKPALTHLDISTAFAGHQTDTHPVVSVQKSPTPIRKGREVNQIPPSPPSFNQNPATYSASTEYRGNTKAATGFPHVIPHKLTRKPGPMSRKRKRRSAVVEIGTGPAKVRIYTINRKDGYDQFTLAWQEGGRRRTRCLSCMEEAKMIGQQITVRLINGVTDTCEATRRDIDLLRYCERTATEYGVTLAAAIEEWASARRTAGEIPLSDAVRFYAANRADLIAVRSIVQVAAEFVESLKRKGVSDIYVRNATNNLKRFSDAVVGNVADVTTSDINRFFDGLTKLGPVSKNGIRRNIVTMFGFAKKQGYLHPDRKTAAEQSDSFKVPDKEISIFTPEEMERLLLAAHARILPLIAIGGFAGIRSAEIHRLHWEDIKWDRGHIEIAGKKAKTAARRLVPLADNLKAWLAPWRGESGPIITISDASGALSDTAVKAQIPGGWRQNALRHSFISYRVAETGDVARTSLEAGNSPKQVFRSYREVVDAEATQAWWAIMPPEGWEPIGLKWSIRERLKRMS